MATVSTIARRAQALALALTLLVPASGRPAPALADEPLVRDHRDPLARFEVVIKRVHVFDDHDWGEGEIEIDVKLVNRWRCPGGVRHADCGGAVVASTIGFNADSRETVTLDRVVPGPGDAVSDPAIGPGIGVPIDSGPGYELLIAGREKDPTVDDMLGFFRRDITEANGVGPLGTYDERGLHCKFPTIPFGDGEGCKPAAFSVEYEIRRTALPDLQPTDFRVTADQPGDRDDQVCFTIQNRGWAASEPFQVSLAIDGAVPPTRDIGAFGLAAGETREQCTGLRLPDSGQLPVSVVVDRTDAIAEMNDRNNELTTGLDRAPAGQVKPQASSGVATADTGEGAQAGEGATILIPAPAQATPAVVARPARVDLTVGAIRVNGRAPDGKADCKDGKNDVVAVVKNGGTGKAGSFAARLSVDGDEAGEVTVPGLDAGQEREVRFDDVRLKKGQQKLVVTLDAKDSVAESDEGNNERPVTTRCNGDD